MGARRENGSDSGGWGEKSVELFFVGSELTDNRLGGQAGTREKQYYNTPESLSLCRRVLIFLVSLKHELRAGENTDFEGSTTTPFSRCVLPVSSCSFLYHSQPFRCRFTIKPTSNPDQGTKEFSGTRGAESAPGKACVGRLRRGAPDSDTTTFVASQNKTGALGAVSTSKDSNCGVQPKIK